MLAFFIFIYLIGLAFAVYFYVRAIMAFNDVRNIKNVLHSINKKLYNVTDDTHDDPNVFATSKNMTPDEIISALRRRLTGLYRDSDKSMPERMTLDMNQEIEAARINMDHYRMPLPSELSSAENFIKWAEAHPEEIRK